MDVKYKFKFGENNANLKSNPKNVRVPLLEKYGEKEFLKDALQDPLQKDWFNTTPLFVSHMRPVRAEDRNYILMDKESKGEKSESEKAIEREIRRFKKETGVLQQENDLEEENNLEQRMKLEDYHSYKREKMKQEMEENRILEERYALDNPLRDKNYAEDIVNTYWNQTEEEMKKERSNKANSSKNNKKYNY